MQTRLEIESLRDKIGDAESLREESKRLAEEIKRMSAQLEAEVQVCRDAQDDCSRAEERALVAEGEMRERYGSACHTVIMFKC